MRKEGRILEAEFFSECPEQGRVFCRLCCCTVGIDSKRFKGHLTSNKHRLALALKLSPAAAASPSASASASVPSPSAVAISPSTFPPLVPPDLFAAGRQQLLGHPNDALAGLIKAVDFAARKHINGRRKGDQSPYINHPLGVANLISEVGGISSLIVLQAAVLHDTLEDTDTSLAEIETFFGTDVASIVAEVTDDKGLNKVARKRYQVMRAAEASYEARLVKLADKLYNLRDLARIPPPNWSIARIQGYCVWSKAVVAQMHGTNARLEAELEAIMSSTIEVPPREGQPMPQVVTFLPPGNLADALEAYYQSLAGVDD